MEGVHTALKTHIGGRAENQDFASKTATALGQLIVLCDGMGGASGGAIASEMATKIIIGEIKKATPADFPHEVIANAVIKANQKIFNHAKVANLRGMGTTVCVLLVNEESAWMAHVGDSRIYQIKNKKIVTVTKDHSHVQELVDKGIIKPEEARNHESSNVITQAVGVRPHVQPTIKEVGFEKNTRFLLCSDGINGEIDDKELIKVAVNGNHLDTVAGNLIGLAHNNGKNSKSGKHDNMTVALVDVDFASRKKAAVTGNSAQSIFASAVAVLCLCILGFLVYDKILHPVETSPDRMEKINDTGEEPNLDDDPEPVPPPKPIPKPDSKPDPKPDPKPPTPGSETKPPDIVPTTDITSTAQKSGQDNQQASQEVTLTNPADYTPEDIPPAPKAETIKDEDYQDKINALLARLLKLENCPDQRDSTCNKRVQSIIKNLESKNMIFTRLIQADNEADKELYREDLKTAISAAENASIDCEQTCNDNQTIGQ